VIVKMESSPAVLRIGELSRRLGVSEHVLRAWERRYGLLRPARSAGGFRLYSEADAQRIRRMQHHLGQGLSAAQAARAAIEDGSAATRPVPDSDLTAQDEAMRALTAVLEEFDEPAAQAVVDRLLSTVTIELVIRDVLMPYLHELGDRWERGEVSVAQEHFASNVVRERLAGLGRGWGRGHGPLAMLACPPGEQHDIALVAFGVVLHRHGWRVDYLGANTPLDDLVRAVAATRAELVVLAATVPEAFGRVAGELARLAGSARVAIAGAGASGSLADSVGAEWLSGDPVTAAERMPVPGRH
jgi:DNA-binding transcriptional MerR regulator